MGKIYLKVGEIPRKKRGIKCKEGVGVYRDVTLYENIGVPPKLMTAWRHFDRALSAGDAATIEKQYRYMLKVGLE